MTGSQERSSVPLPRGHDLEGEVDGRPRRIKDVDLDSADGHDDLGVTDVMEERRRLRNQRRPFDGASSPPWRSLELPLPTQVVVEVGQVISKPFGVRDSLQKSVNRANELRIARTSLLRELCEPQHVLYRHHEEVNFIVEAVRRFR